MATTPLMVLDAMKRPFGEEATAQSVQREVLPVPGNDRDPSPGSVLSVLGAVKERVCWAGLAVHIVQTTLVLTTTANWL